jgi:hypothetical protein
MFHGLKKCLGCFCLSEKTAWLLKKVFAHKNCFAKKGLEILCRQKYMAWQSISQSHSFCNLKPVPREPIMHSKLARPPFSEVFFRVTSLFVWLVRSERKVLLAGCWWLVCSERKVLLAGG